MGFINLKPDTPSVFVLKKITKRGLKTVPNRDLGDSREIIFVFITTNVPKIDPRLDGLHPSSPQPADAKGSGKFR